MAESTISAAIERAFSLLHDGEPEEAKKVLEEETARAESSDRYKSSKEAAYFSFAEAMEEVLYQQEYHPSADVRAVREPVSSLYLVYGSILAQTGEIMKGQEELRKAMKWDPVSCDILLEYADTYRMLGSYEAYRDVTVRAFQFAFLPEQVGRCLSSVGSYFELLEMWPEAAGYYALSLACDRDNAAVREHLAAVQEKAGRSAEDISTDYMRAISLQYGTPLGANEGVIRTADRLGSKAQENGDDRAAHYFLNIAQGLAPFAISVRKE